MVQPALLPFPGEAEQAGLPQPVPLQRLLRLRQAEGAGVQEHRVDRRVHRPAAPRQDRQLHPHFLSAQLIPSFNVQLQFSGSDPVVVMRHFPVHPQFESSSRRFLKLFIQLYANKQQH